MQRLFLEIYVTLGDYMQCVKLKLTRFVCLVCAGISGKLFEVKTVLLIKHHQCLNFFYLFI